MDAQHNAAAAPTSAMTRNCHVARPLRILLWAALALALFSSLLGRVHVLLAADVDAGAGADSADYYAILEVDPTADGGAIKKAYRRLALRWHPDKHWGDGDKEEATSRFTRINEAFETLGDEERRREYDADLLLSRQKNARGRGDGGGPPNQQRRQQQQYDTYYQQPQWQQPQRQQQYDTYYQQQPQYQRDGGGPEYYEYRYQEPPAYESTYYSYTTHSSHPHPHRDPYEQFHSAFSRAFGYDDDDDDDDDDDYYDEYARFFGTGREGFQRRRRREHRPQSLDDWLDLAVDASQRALGALDRGIDRIGHAIVDAARDIFVPEGEEGAEDEGYMHDSSSWNFRSKGRGTRRQHTNDRWGGQKDKMGKWWGKAKRKSRQWSQKVQKSKHARKLRRVAKTAKSRIESWVRNIDASIDKQTLEWIRKSQQKASDAARMIWSAFNQLILGDDDIGEEDDYTAYSSQSSRKYYQNGVETTVQTFYDDRGNRVEEVYLNGMLAERYVNGVPM